MRDAQKVLTALRKCHRWVAEQDDGHLGFEQLHRATDIGSACITILRESPVDYSDWIQQKNRRRLIAERIREFTERPAVNRGCGS